MDDLSTVVVDVTDDVVFEEAKGLKRKKRSILPTTSPFVCPAEDCGKVFESRVRLQRHFRNHAEKKHACSFCGYKFLYLKDKRIHERMHTGERPYVCQVCDKAFVQKCTLHNHLIRHNKSIKDEICHVCGRGYYYKKSLAQHIKDKHTDGPVTYACPHCGKKYLGHSVCKSHSERCKVRTSLTTCGRCGVTFDDSAVLQTHQQSCCDITNEPLLDRRFECGMCLESLVGEESVKRHMSEKHQISLNEFPLFVDKEESNSIMFNSLS